MTEVPEEGQPPCDDVFGWCSSTVILSESEFAEFAELRNLVSDLTLPYKRQKPHLAARLLDRLALGYSFGRSTLCDRIDL